MKKMIWLALGLAVLLTACGPKTDGDTVTDSAAQTGETVTEQETSSETETEESVPTETTEGEEETRIAYDSEEILFLVGLPDMNRRLVISEDRDGKYLVCRCYSDQHLDFQYPAVLDETSYDQFDLHYEMREGNDGMTSVELTFTKDYEEWTLFDQYDNQGEARYCGVRIKDIPTDMETGDYVADEVVGSLSVLLDNEKLMEE